MKLTIEAANEHFLQAFSKSYETMKAHMDKIPNGFSRRSFMYGSAAIFADHGEGQYVYTIDGRKLLDFNNNFTVNVLGYAHPAVNEAIIEAMKRAYSFGNPTEPEYELAGMLADTQVFLYKRHRQQNNEILIRHSPGWVSAFCFQVFY